MKNNPQNTIKNLPTNTVESKYRGFDIITKVIQHPVLPFYTESVGRLNGEPKFGTCSSSQLSSVERIQNKIDIYLSVMQSK